MFRPILIVVVSLMSMNVGADPLRLADLAGEQTLSFVVPGKADVELCVIPRHFSSVFPAAKYSKKDLANEAKLCALDIDKQVSACPKEYSTNPGVLFMEPRDGKTIIELGSDKCSDEAASKEAKYKLSTSCSYTPALLGYYHMSRVLGRISKVPVAVVRTLDLDRHKAIAAQALRDLSGNKTDLIYQTWSGLNSLLNSGASGKKDRADKIFVENYRQTYGALQKNPKGEEKYKEFFNGGTDRVAAFKSKNSVYAALTKVSGSVPRELTAENLQLMVQMRDASDMILLDTILGQQDRFGNIHYGTYYFYPTTKKDGSFNLESEEKLKDVPVELQSRALAIKELMLKDNDCGVAKENRIKAGRLLDGVSHMDPSTYHRLQQFARVIGNADVKDIFLRDLLFSEQDYKVVSANLVEAAQLLRDRCVAGKLRLDLDIDQHFAPGELVVDTQCIE